MNIAGIDEIDNMLLTLLQENARMSYSEMAAKVGLSRVAVKNRIQIMEEIGVISGYKAVITPNAVDNSVEFVMTVCPRAEHYDYVLGILGKSSHITRLHAATGNCKIIAYGVAPNSKDMDEFYRKIRRIFTEVQSFSFDVIASTFKDVDGGIEYGNERTEISNTGEYN